MNSVTAVARSAFVFKLCSGAPSWPPSSRRSILKASDIMADGSNGAGQTCDGISIGLGFDAVQIEPAGGHREPGHRHQRLRGKRDGGEDGGTVGDSSTSGDFEQRLGRQRLGRPTPATAPRRTPPASDSAVRGRARRSRSREEAPGRRRAARGFVFEWLLLRSPRSISNFDVTAAAFEGDGAESRDEVSGSSSGSGVETAKSVPRKTRLDGEKNTRLDPEKTVKLHGEKTRLDGARVRRDVERIRQDGNDVLSVRRFAKPRDVAENVAKGEEKSSSPPMRRLVETETTGFVAAM